MIKYILQSEISHSNISSVKSLLKFNRLYKGEGKEFSICDVTGGQFIFSYPKDNSILDDDTIEILMKEINSVDSSEGLQILYSRFYWEVITPIKDKKRDEEKKKMLGELGFNINWGGRIQV